MKKVKKEHKTLMEGHEKVCHILEKYSKRLEGIEMPNILGDSWKKERNTSWGTVQDDGVLISSFWFVFVGANRPMSSLQLSEIWGGSLRV